MKAKLVIEMPSCCIDCIGCTYDYENDDGHFCYSNDRKIDHDDYDCVKPDWCPLEPIEGE